MTYPHIANIFLGGNPKRKKEKKKKTFSLESSSRGSWARGPVHRSSVELMDDVVVGWLVGRSVGGCVFERQLTSGWLVGWLVGSSENDSGLFDGGTGTSSYIWCNSGGRER